jgi:hypothetical protein
MARKKIFTPRCLCCGRKLKPKYNEFSDNDPDLPFHRQPDFKSRIYGYGYEGGNVFCSITCGYNFAMATVQQTGIIVHRIKEEISKANTDRGYLPDGFLPLDQLKQIYDLLVDKDQLKIYDRKSYDKLEWLNQNETDQ